MFNPYNRMAALNHAGQIERREMGNEKLVRELKESIAFFERELAEFTKERDDVQTKLDASGIAVDSDERKNMADEIDFLQEFVDESAKSLAQYQARLEEIIK